MSRQQQQQEELFLHPDSTQPEFETPPPLRITKQPSASPEPRPQWAQYRVPPSAAAQYGMPTSPPPTGPLPYPDETRRRPAKPPSRTGTPQASSMAAEEGEGRAVGPPGVRSTSIGSDASSGGGSAGSKRRPRFSPHDPNRPTVSGYGTSPPSSASGHTIGRLAERRGTPAKKILPPESPGGPEPPPKSGEYDTFDPNKQNDRARHDGKGDVEEEEEGEEEGEEEEEEEEWERFGHDERPSNAQLGVDEPDEESGTLFSIPVVRGGQSQPTKPMSPSTEGGVKGPMGGGVSDYQHFYPPPLATTTSGPSSAPPAQAQAAMAGQSLHIPNDTGISRLSSTASNATTRASRGSPPPPETPIDPSGGPTAGLSGIEARYAASGIPGTNTLNEMQAQSAAAAARRAHYESPRPQRGTPGVVPPQAQPLQPQGSGGSSNSGRWSPTERAGSRGPPVAFHGVEEVSSRGSDVPTQSRRARQASQSSAPGQTVYPTPPQPSTGRRNDPLDPGMQNLSLSDEPPPAYSPPAAGSAHSPYPNEKGIRAQNNASPARSGASAGSRKSTIDPNIASHPAFANRQQPSPSPQPSSSQQAQQAQHMNGAGGTPHGMTPINTQQANSASPGPGQAAAGAGPASPPPLPEGWIAHLDNNSGQYYYIHLPTQSTQWEFPKGPTPLNLEPLSPTGTNSNSFNHPMASPTGSMFKQPLASPSFGPGAMSGMPGQTQYAGYAQDPRQSMMSINSLTSPTASGFTGPPPSAGVDLYRVQPTNNVYFGPYLRYTNIDLERGLWLGSIMLITDAAQPPTIHIHQSTDLSPNPRQLKAHPIYSHQRWLFYRYDVDLRMEEKAPAKWTYAITSHLGCTRYEFLVAGRYETSWRFVAHSGNDFAINVSANERAKLGGVGLMWKDVLLKHQECGGFHTQIGLGGQIYADRLWKDIPALKAWTQMSGKENRKNAPWTPKMDEDVTHAFFHYYTSHYDQPAVREAFAQIPHICCLDDHDIFDGFGSYPEYMQQSNTFKNLGRIGIEMYLLFQHHTTHEILRAVSNDIDLFTITGQGWHFLKYLGPSVVLVGPDTRSERTNTQVMAGPTYQGLFPKVAVLPPSVQHCIWLFPVPLIYPRLEAVEQVAKVATTGKKMATGGFNMLGKVAGGVAGVVGAKGVVSSGFDGIKKAVGKSGLMQNVLSPFGEVEVLDELRDMWTHESKDLERTYIFRTLQGISHNKSLRVTFLSGSVSACGAGLLHDPAHPSDHKTMYQLITSPITNAPAPSYVIKLLHTTKPLYIPLNGHRSSSSSSNPAVTDTKEDMMEIFAVDVGGEKRGEGMRRLMGRRNYLACVVFDPEVVQGAFGAVTPGVGSGRLSLAADFMVQGDSLAAGGGGMPMKYGPVVVPSLEYGR